MKRKFEGGFSLVELIVAVSIIAILTGIALVNFNRVRMQARDARRQVTMNGIQTALECYYRNNGNYPSSIAWAGLPSTFNVNGSCIGSGAISDPSGPVSSGGRVPPGVGVVLAQYAYSRTSLTTYLLTLNGETNPAPLPPFTWTNPN